ncbi:MAG: hypothetical protein AAGE61_13620 [Pseudomonadota bacterium]
MLVQTVNSSRSVSLLGLGAAVWLVILQCAYALALAFGLSALPSANDPIGDPFFTIMELLIIFMMPAFIVLTVAIHASCAARRKPYALAALVFVSILVALTTTVHTSILFLSRSPDYADIGHIFAFEWPSVAYVIDVLAWDFFFGFFAIFLAFSLERKRLEGWARGLLFVSGVLALAGLFGAAVGDMSIRSIGIIGYVGTFTVAVALIALVMRRRLTLAQ